MFGVTRWLIVLPKIGKLISDIDRNDILEVLEPVWYEKEKTDMASKLRGRIRRIFDYASFKGVVRQTEPRPMEKTTLIWFWFAKGFEDQPSLALSQSIWKQRVAGNRLTLLYHALLLRLWRHPVWVGNRLRLNGARLTLIRKLGAYRPSVERIEKRPRIVFRYRLKA